MSTKTMTTLVFQIVNSPDCAFRDYAHLPIAFCSRESLRTKEMLYWRKRMNNTTTIDNSHSFHSLWHIWPSEEIHQIGNLTCSGYMRNCIWIIMNDCNIRVRSGHIMWMNMNRQRHEGIDTTNGLSIDLGLVALLVTMPDIYFCPCCFGA